MTKEALAEAEKALENCSVERDIAAHMKKYFDNKHNMSWQCIVGSKFGINITYQEYCYIYFTIGPVSILLFKAG